MAIVRRFDYYREQEPSCLRVRLLRVDAYPQPRHLSYFLLSTRVELTPTLHNGPPRRGCDYAGSGGCRF